MVMLVINGSQTGNAGKYAVGDSNMLARMKGWSDVSASRVTMLVERSVQA